jgi:Fe-S cluster assembly scaffold protein SufB
MQIKDLFSTEAAIGTASPLKQLAQKYCEQHDLRAKQAIWQRLSMREVLNTPVKKPVKSASNSIGGIKPSADQTIQLVFTNGSLVQPVQSTAMQTHHGIEIDTSALDAEKSDGVWSQFIANAEGDITPAVAIICGQSAHRITVSKDVHLELVYVATDASPSVGYHIQVDVAADVTASISQQVIPQDGDTPSTILVSRRITLAKHAKWLERVIETLPNVNFLQTQQVDCAHGAHYQGFYTLAGGHACRHVSHIRLNEPTASADVVALGLLSDKQRHDHTILMKHNAPHTQSKQEIKNVVSDHALSNFTSRVYVRSGIANVESSQLNHNLLLSDKARALTAPELEIYSDEVQCAHGATVGALDEKALFYLQARGLDQEQAQALLVEGFMNDIIEGQSAAIRKQAHRVTKTFLESSKS